MKYDYEYDYSDWKDECSEYVEEQINEYIKENIKCNYFILNGELAEDIDVILDAAYYIWTESTICWEKEDYTDLQLWIKWYFEEDFVIPVWDNMVDLIEKFETLQGVC